MSTPVQPLRVPLLAPAAAGWLGALVLLPGSAGRATWCAAAALVVCAAAVVGVVRTGSGAGGVARWGVLALVAAGVAAVTASCAGVLAVRAAGPWPALVAQQAVVQVQGQVSGDPRAVRSTFPGEPRFGVPLRVAAVVARGRTLTAPADLLVVGRGSWAAVRVGGQVRAVGRLGPPRSLGRVVAVLDAGRPPVTLAPPGGVWRAAEHLRSGLRGAVAGAPPDAGGLLPALVVGDTSAVPADLVDALRAAGLTHLTAVSGANLAITVGGVLVLALVLGLPRTLRLALAAFTVVAFVVVARPEPSVVRAAAMGTVALVGLWTGRGGRGLQVLGAAVVGLLVLDPWLARTPGFALSVLATAALLVLAGPFADRLPARWPRGLRLALAVPVAAQAATAPVVLLLQPGVSLVGVPANVLAAPATVVATMSGAAATALAPLTATGAALVARPGLLAAAAIARVARTAAAVPGATLPWPQGARGAAAAALAALALVLLVLAVRRSTRRRARPARRAARRTAPAGPGAPTRFGRVVAGCVAAALALGVGWVAAPTVPGRAAVSWPPAGWFAVQCDVGQGAASVVPTGPGRAVLIDTGPDPSLVDGCLRRLHVEHLDLVVLTHFHADHVLGLSGALRGRSVGDVLVSPLAEPAENAAEVARLLADAGAHPVPAWAGRSGASGPGGSVRWRVLWPSPPLPTGDGRADGEEGTVVNDASVVTLLEVAGHEVLVLGDVEPDAQAGVLRAVPAGLAAVDVVVVAHHGSARQVPALYRRVRPAVALVGVGENDYGHPAPATLALLEAAGAVTRRTDTDGDVAVVATAEGLATARRAPP